MMRVGLAGFGAAGQEVARRLVAGAVPGVRLTAVTARDLNKARANAARLARAPAVVPLPEILRVCLGAGRTVLVVSAAGLLAMPEAEQLARRGGGRLRIANGALPGLDSLRCAREGNIRSVRLTSRLRPDSLAHEDYVLRLGLDFVGRPHSEAVRVFQGSARQAAAAFPRHFNVAVALGIAGIGFDRTEIEVWADPEVAGAVHQVEVDAEDIGLTMISRNRPSANPRTSRIVAPSIVAGLRAMVAPLIAGG
jgi:aspartate dehydrogenase